MRRPRFSLKTLLWLMVVVAALLGGMVLQRDIDQAEFRRLRTLMRESDDSVNSLVVERHKLARDLKRIQLKQELAEQSAKSQ